VVQQVLHAVTRPCLRVLPAQVPDQQRSGQVLHWVARDAVLFVDFSAVAGHVDLLSCGRVVDARRYLYLATSCCTLWVHIASNRGTFIIIFMYLTDFYEKLRIRAVRSILLLLTTRRCELKGLVYCVAGAVIVALILSNFGYRSDREDRTFAVSSAGGMTIYVFNSDMSPEIPGADGDATSLRFVHLLALIDRSNLSSTSI
jgi:hypothetical protein